MSGQEIQPGLGDDSSWRSRADAVVASVTGTSHLLEQRHQEEMIWAGAHAVAYEESYRRDPLLLPRHELVWNMAMDKLRDHGRELWVQDNGAAQYYPLSTGYMEIQEPGFPEPAGIQPHTRAVRVMRISISMKSLRNSTFPSRAAEVARGAPGWGRRANAAAELAKALKGVRYIRMEAGVAMRPTADNWRLLSGHGHGKVVPAQSRELIVDKTIRQAQEIHGNPAYLSPCIEGAFSRGEGLTAWVLPLCEFPRPDGSGSYESVKMPAPDIAPIDRQGPPQYTMTEHVAALDRELAIARERLRYLGVAQDMMTTMGSIPLQDLIDP